MSLHTSVKFQASKLVLTHSCKDFFEIHVHAVPDPSMWTHSGTPSVLLLGEPLASHRIALPNASDARVAHMVGISQSDTASFLAFDLGTKLNCARLPLRARTDTPDAAAPVQALRLAEMSSAEAIATGSHRAVWLEHNWEVDEVRVMKFWWEECQDGAIVPKMGVLIPPEAELLVQPAEVRALALDEAAGRLCLASDSGSVFVLDYADE